jgi:hypothetical protein
MAAVFHAPCAKKAAFRPSSLSARAGGSARRVLGRSTCKMNLPRRRMWGALNLIWPLSRPSWQSRLGRGWPQSRDWAGRGRAENRYRGHKSQGRRSCDQGRTWRSKGRYPQMDGRCNRLSDGGNCRCGCLVRQNLCKVSRPSPLLPFARAWSPGRASWRPRLLPCFLPRDEAKRAAGARRVLYIERAAPRRDREIDNGRADLGGT